MAGHHGDQHAGFYRDSDYMLPVGSSSTSARTRLQAENDGLKSQLESARGIIKVVASGGVGAEGAVGGGDKKRPRLGDARGRDGRASSSVALPTSGDKIRADRLEAELEESRVLREKDKVRYEIMLRQGEGDKGKLLRQIKFLSQEEEEARAIFDKKEVVFLDEISRLQESLAAERAQLRAAGAETGRESEQERQGYARKLRREEEARRVAEEKAKSLQETARTCANEVAELRKRRRVLEVKNADLSLEVSSLRRQQGLPAAAAAEGGGRAAVAAAAAAAVPEASSLSWDTPAARELRAQIKSLEKEGRKREAVLQRLEEDRRNVAALEDEVVMLRASLQRAEGRLSAAADAEVESAAIKDEKEEWALVFARAVEDGKKQVGGQQVEEQEETEAPRPTPLVALRLLLESQEERSLSVKELTALRLRYGSITKRLAQAEQELKQGRESAESARSRAEDLEAALGKLQRRCRSAEQEVEAQKELIRSYERDNFRKPAEEGWLSEHASSLRSALAAAKDEAKSLREAAEGQLSALEGRRLRERAAKAEEALGVAVAERDAAVKAADMEGEKRATAEKEWASGTGLREGKVLTFRDNPAAKAAEAARNEAKRQVQVLTEENKRLAHQLESAGGRAMDSFSMSADEGVSVLGGPMLGMRGGDYDAEKYNARLKKMYKERVNYYRQAVYSLTGYRIDLMKDPAKQMLRLRSMYAEQESDCLLFQQTDEKDGGGLQLVETPFVLQHTEKIEFFLGKCGSIPAFLSSLTIELFEKQTQMPG